MLASCRTQSSNYLRRDACREDPPFDLITTAGDDELWWHAPSTEDVLAVLDRLPEDQRVAFRMFAFEGKSYTEIAAAQGIAKPTVGTPILRARLRIREILTKERSDG